MALFLTNNNELAKKINSSIFPGIQGGPLEHVIAAKAVAFEEALQPRFTTYQKSFLAEYPNLVKNSSFRKHGHCIGRNRQPPYFA